MEHPKTQVFASEYLASVAPEASDVLLDIAIQNKSGSASQIATRLLYIADELSKQGLYQLPPIVQSLSLQILRDLVNICNWPMLLTPRYHPHTTESPQELHGLLTQMFKTKSSKDHEQSIQKFCKERPNTIKPFQSRFITLSDELIKNTKALQNTGSDIAAYDHLRPLPKDVYPDKINQLLFDGVKRSASCVQAYHAGDGTLLEDVMHSTRLCLNSGFRFKNQVALFNIITATSKMVYWQELAICIPINEIGEKDAQNPQECKSFAFRRSDSSLVGDGGVCKQLESPSFSRIYLDLDENCKLYERSDPEQLQHLISGCGVQLSELLKRCDLTVEHKIKLSYAVARAFWQFYSSELLNARWTGEDILFIPTDEESFDLKGIPLRAFVSFPFGNEYKESPAEFYDKNQYTHRYPRILYLGIVLLEIGLGQPLGLELNTRLSLLAHTNTVHVKAKKKLQELKEAEWDGFRWKDYFVEAIENCLDSTNFKDIPKHQKSRRHGDLNAGDETVNHSPLPERRDALYRKVVAPLSWLATGFEGTEEVPVVPLRKKIRRASTIDDNGEIQSFWNGIRENPSFNSGTPSNHFLGDLQRIAEHIFRCRRKAKITTPIRVAILDTGCRRDLAFFQDSRRSNRLKGWKDFTSMGSESETDTFGHGTFMARLLMHVAPIVDVYLIRVAKNTSDLENNQENIAQAIEHAGLDPDWNVDVISMSFGFSNKPGKTYPAISDAIEKVRRERKGSVLLLASAGNSWGKGRCFPASHPDVIPIYAGNSKGKFLDSTPTQTGKGSKKLGTYGSDIPADITGEVTAHFPKADLGAGTSIATAIASGIVAMTLSYIAALPSLLKITGFDQLFASLYTKRGMEQMLYSMSLQTDYRQQFINPVWFWGQKQKDRDFFVSICLANGRMNEEE